MFGIPEQQKQHNSFAEKLPQLLFPGAKKLSPIEKVWSVLTFFLGTLSLFFVISLADSPVQKFISPLVATFTGLEPLKNPKKGHEIFGFAPYWTINKLESVDFETLTTLAYFGVPVTGTGDLNRDDQGYQTFMSEKATRLFKKAHAHDTRVVLTLTMMDNDDIDAVMSDPAAQQNTIDQAIAEVKKRGIDGVNVDAEYVGNPGSIIRDNFSTFMDNLTKQMHAAIPNSQVTVSVYASAAKSPKLDDIGALGKSVDGVFMMAYDFAVTGSDQAMPTAPLYGYKEGKYSYDVATAVEDFLKVMPAEKLIMGVPYYGYNYAIYGNPQIKAETRPSWSWRGAPATQTYAIALENVVADKEGWDAVGQVGWKAYYVAETDTWRMIFLDDERSLKAKYAYSKTKNLLGVGMWALGFDDGHPELWALLKQEFGTKDIADSRVVGTLN